MSTYWLHNALKGATGVQSNGAEQLLVVQFAGRSEKIYCPTSDEYIVSAEVVLKAKELGATIVAYGDSWCDATLEAKNYGRQIGVSVMKYSSFFAYLRRHGVLLRNDE